LETVDMKMKMKTLASRLQSSLNCNCAEQVQILYPELKEPETLRERNVMKERNP